jgi:hypothetical protein
MKKFSTSIGQKVNEEPKVEVKKVNEEEIFKSKVLDLMDDFLRIQTYGPVDRYLRAGSIKITGKELFLEALMTLMSDKSNKESKAILESLKSEIRDWSAIDNKIEELVDNNIDKKINEIKHSKKLLSIYEKWRSDKKLCINMFEKHIDGIKTPENAFQKYLACVELSKKHDNKDIFEIISEKYLEKAKQLGFSE